MEPEITVTDDPPPEARAAILSGLVGFNQGLAGPSERRPLAVLLRDSGGDVLGGLIGATAWGWLSIELLYVPEALRGRNLGARLIGTAEEEALRRGCRQALVDTYSFQAPDFYQRLGYRVFGQLEDFPPGYRRYFLRKVLEPSSSSGAEP